MSSEKQFSILISHISYLTSQISHLTTQYYLTTFRIFTPMEFEHLKLSNQFCFPVYAVSRLITRAYQPLLEELNLTYPQYLVLLVLWENDGLTVNEITHTLILNTNTVTPLLKRMEKQGLITRKRSEQDERKVLIHLTKKGKDLRIQASSVPYALVEKMGGGDVDEAIAIRDKLNQMIEQMRGRE